jgi:hypothetical protein
MTLMVTLACSSRVASVRVVCFSLCRYIVVAARVVLSGFLGGVFLDCSNLSNGF